MEQSLIEYFALRSKGESQESILEALKKSVDSEVMKKHESPREAMKASTAIYKERVSALKRLIHAEASAL